MTLCYLEYRRCSREKFESLSIVKQSLKGPSVFYNVRETANCVLFKHVSASVWNKSREVVEQHGDKIESLSLTIKRVNEEAVGRYHF